MTSFTFSVEQLKSAPAEIRQWIFHQLESDLAALTSGNPEPPAAHAPALAACTPDETMQIFDLIRGDFATAQVFLELARDTPIGNGGRPLHVMSLGEMIRHTRLDQSRLAGCLQMINQAFRQVRNDPDAVLFGFDQANHVYVHEATHQSIRALWEGLTRLPMPPSAEAAPAFAAPPLGFAPRQMGPSEDIATHHPQ